MRELLELIMSLIGAAVGAVLFGMIFKGVYLLFMLGWGML